MTHRIYNNRYRGTVDILVYASNSSVRVTGNNSVSNLTVNASSDEIITGGMLTRVITGGESESVWAISSGNSTANSVLGYFGGNFDFNLKDGMSVPLIGDNLYANLITGANASILLEVKKAC